MVFPTRLHVCPAQRSACPSRQSNQNLCMHSVGSQGFKVSSGQQQKLRSDCADSQADLSLLSALMKFFLGNVMSGSSIFSHNRSKLSLCHV